MNSHDILGINHQGVNQTIRNELTVMPLSDSATLEGKIVSNDRERTYLLHLPHHYDGKTPLPLVIVLHGGTANAQNAEMISGFTEKSDKEGFIVVYPNGSGRLKNRVLTWNGGNCCGYALEHNVDDVEFIRRLINKLQQELTVDCRRIFVTGISNGGMLTYRLACELSDTIAAIAPIAAAMNYEPIEVLDSVSVIIFHGTDDDFVVYEGGKPRKTIDTRHKRIDKPVSHAVSFWTKHNEYPPTPQKKENGNITKETYCSGKNGTEVVLYTIKGGNHSWPGGLKAYERGDAPTTEISATDVMWEFFKNHPKQ